MTNGQQGMYPLLPIFDEINKYLTYDHVFSSALQADLSLKSRAHFA
jgi:hypothetical protein